MFYLGGVLEVFLLMGDKEAAWRLYGVSKEVSSLKDELLPWVLATLKDY